MREIDQVCGDRSAGCGVCFCGWLAELELFENGFSTSLFVLLSLVLALDFDSDGTIFVACCLQLCQTRYKLDDVFGSHTAHRVMLAITNEAPRRLLVNRFSSVGGRRIGTAFCDGCDSIGMGDFGLRAICEFEHCSVVGVVGLRECGPRCPRA